MPSSSANLGILGVALDEISDTNLRQILNDICLVKGYLLEEDYTLTRLSDVDGGLSDVDSRLSGAEPISSSGRSPSGPDGQDRLQDRLI
jgi:hypothetical protein